MRKERRRPAARAWLLPTLLVLALCVGAAVAGLMLEEALRESAPPPPSRRCEVHGAAGHCTLPRHRF